MMGVKVLAVAIRTKEETVIESLLSQMTLEEKIGQLNQVGTSIYGGNEQHYEELVRDGKVGSFLSIKEIQKANRLQEIAINETRLGIPLLFAEDVVHGFRTTFPIPLAESCSWNPKLMEESAKIAAEEAAAAGIHWTFAPMVDVSRDPRWGRVAECFGEDPFLNGEFGAAKVRGFQGNKDKGQLDENHIIACGKHFVGYSEAEAGRDYNTVDVSWYKLANNYIPPFKRLIDEGVLTMMSSFNALNGIPATVNKKLLIEILREKLEFLGLLISDWNALRETITHGYSKNAAEATLKGMDCGLDVDMSSRLYSEELENLVKSGLLEEKKIDAAVRQILSLKWQLGLFEQPYRSSYEKNQVVMAKQGKFREKAREIAEESIVLLKNEGLLPLQAEDKVGFAGPFFTDGAGMLDTWACKGEVADIVTVAQAVAQKNNPRYASLSNLYQQFQQTGYLSEKDKKLIEKLDKMVILLGEKATDSGEAKSKAILTLEKVQQNFLQVISEINPRIIVVLMNGRPLVLETINQQAMALIEAWHLGCEAGPAILNILEGKRNPSGKLTMSFPKNEGQIPTYYNHFMTGRPFQRDKFNTSKYIDIDNEPTYPFGFGLSYTQFSLAQLRIVPQGKNHWQAEIEVTNNGPFAGQEVIQLYIGAQYGTYIRPVQELKDFQKIYLAAGDSQKVCFEIDQESLVYFDEDLHEIQDPGEYLIMIGTSSQIEQENIKRIEVE